MNIIGYQVLDDNGATYAFRHFHEVFVKQEDAQKELDKALTEDAQNNANYHLVPVRTGDIAIPILL